MLYKELGFIGGGRATRIILGGLRRAGKMPRRVLVSDTDESVLRELKKTFPVITPCPGDNPAPASARGIVFISLHPPAFRSSAAKIRGALDPSTVVVSFMATVRIEEIGELLGGHDKILRTTPNAPSIVNAGYNPIAFGPGLTAEDRQEVMEMMTVLGKCPEVEEGKLESYAIITAMGPTYLWFQLYELERLAVEFGLGRGEAGAGVREMALGAVKTMQESGLTADEVMDLVPIRPLGDDEKEILDIYRQRLRGLKGRLLCK